MPEPSKTRSMARVKSPLPSAMRVTLSPTSCVCPHAFMTKASLTATHAMSAGEGLIHDSFGGGEHFGAGELATVGNHIGIAIVAQRRPHQLLSVAEADVILAPARRGGVGFDAAEHPGGVVVTSELGQH